MTNLVAAKMDACQSDEFEGTLPFTFNWLQVSKMHLTNGRYSKCTTIFYKLLDFGDAGGVH